METIDSVVLAFRFYCNGQKVGLTEEQKWYVVQAIQKAAVQGTHQLFVLMGFAGDLNKFEDFLADCVGVRKARVID